jgi:hypothetical protein
MVNLENSFLVRERTCVTSSQVAAKKNEEMARVETLMFTSLGNPTTIGKELIK